MSQVRSSPLSVVLAEAEAAMRARDPRTALAAFEKAKALGASAKQIARGHALALSDLGRHAEAVEVYRPFFRSHEADANVANLMGVLLKRAGRLEMAVSVLLMARKRSPQNASLWHNLGNVYELQAEYGKAEEAFRGALRIDPKSRELWRLHARQLLAMGRLGEAADSLKQAVALGPSDLGLIALLVQTLQRAGRIEEARSLVEKLRQAAPDDLDIAVIDARLAFRTGHIEQALQLLLKIVGSNPGHLHANLQLAVIYGDGDREKANIALERAVAAHPDKPEPLERLIESRTRSRYGSEGDHIERSYALAKTFIEKFPARIPDAARTLRSIFMRVLDEDMMARTGDHAQLLPRWLADGLHASVHYELGRVKNIEDRLRLVEWHRAWGRKASAHIKPVTPVAMPAISTGRKLRIGFMSSDLRNHPITYFTLPLLESYDRDRVEVFCYSFYEGATDRVQAHIEKQVTAFHLWPKKPDSAVAEDVARDGLDILFELGGSTAMNKLEVMAYKPARIGASWLGYPHSAGLEQIDLVLTDPYIKPEDPRLLLERPFEMPETWVALSRMFAEIEITEGIPQQHRGYLTFGTANNPYKFTSACIDAWAAVLRAVPASRFLLLRPEGGVECFMTNVRKAFARRDVDPERLEFVGVRGDHMRHYNKIDIALDSLPHVGGTTTCEALWMGVPTISLVGPGFPERLSYSNLTNAGLGNLATFSLEGYVAKAAELAADPAYRLSLRHGLRTQIRANPLGQPDRFTKHFYEQALKVAAE
jgi:predicted O-linked N-acetylglucosamine transferase (SPINDLY family)